MTRVAVFGASGFVGTELVERLIKTGKYDVLPAIRSTGNAWALSRHGIDLHMVDLLNGNGVDELLRGTDCVINCTRGDKDVMLDGLSLLLKRCKKHQIKRFIHISSVMFYGDPPEAKTEDAPTPKQQRSTYGAIKLRQDEMVASAARAGLAACIIVPPNISGPNSPFLLSIVESLERHEIALMDGESPIVNLVDVRNLCRGIELAMIKGADDGSRYFVTDDESTTWRDLISDLQDLQVGTSITSHISRDELERLVSQLEIRRISVRKSIKHLFSSHIRQALREDALWELVDIKIRGLVSKLGGRAEERLRLTIEGPKSIRCRTSADEINLGLCGQQLRRSRYSVRKARDELGYTPELSYRQSIDRFKCWYQSVHALNGEFGDLKRLKIRDK